MNVVGGVARRVGGGGVGVVVGGGVGVVVGGGVVSPNKESQLSQR